MRHVWSLLLALVLTPLIYAAAGVSAVRLSDARGLNVTVGVGLAAGLAAGCLYALLVMARLSPVGPTVAGLIYLGVTIYALVDRSGFESLIPADLFGEQGALRRPVGAGTALLAAPLILTVFSSRRWRDPAQPGTNAYDAAPVYPTTVPSAAPSYPDTVPTAAPSYSPGTGLSASTYEPPVYIPPTYPAPFPAGGAQPAGDETQRTGLM
jgi:hypothetical protein